MNSIERSEFWQEWGLSIQAPTTVCFYVTSFKHPRYLPFVWRGYDIKIWNLDKDYHENEKQRWYASIQYWIHYRSIDHMVKKLPYKYILSANNKVLLVYFAFRTDPQQLSVGNYLYKNKTAAYLPNTLYKKKVKVLNSERIVYY